MSSEFWNWQFIMLMTFVAVTFAGLFVAQIVMQRRVARERKERKERKAIYDMMVQTNLRRLESLPNPGWGPPHD
jgi:uncharacterized protein YpmS